MEDVLVLIINVKQLKTKMLKIYKVFLLIFTFIFIFFILIFLLEHGVLGQKNLNYDISSIKKEFKNKDEVKIRIFFAKNYNQRGSLFKKSWSSEQTKIESAKIKEKFKKNFVKDEIIREFEDSIVVKVREEELEKIIKDENIERIKIDIPVKKFLQDSVPLINATKVWSIDLSGQNITGIDETICILDTGINFSHPDLLNKNKTCIIDCFEKECIENCSISDDDGHGTLVAGVAVANGNLKGVAIGASVIGVKVLNSSGGSSSDIEAGIEWCINNSQKYNISVISMSLGTDCDSYPESCFEEYCDDFEYTFTEKVNRAIEKNISVIAASGNHNNYTHISHPACIKNVTAVAGTQKNDDFFIISNRNKLIDLVAPAKDINSTYFAGYSIASGTSLAAPHVAGAFALIKQFGRMYNKTILKPSEIESILNSSGKRIYDSASNLNFSRIDVYSAIASIDKTPPNITLVTPEDEFLTGENYSVRFKCNSSDVQISKVVFYLWNETGVVNYSILNFSGNSANLEINISNISYGNYKWNCYSYDFAGNYNYNTNNFSLYVGNIKVILNNPANNISVNYNLNEFNCTSKTLQIFSLTNVTFFIWNSSDISVYNSTKIISGTDNLTNFSYYINNDGTYSWNCLSYNNESSYSFGESNFTITLDRVYPVINYISNYPSFSSAVINYSLNEDSNYTISYGTNIEITSKISNSSFSNYHSILLSDLLSSTTYYYNLTSCDRAGNCINNGTFNFTTQPQNTYTALTGTSSGGGSGRGSIFNTFLIENLGPYEKTKELKERDRIKFRLSKYKEYHYLTVNNIKRDYANITVNSDFFNFVLKVGETKKLNLSSRYPNFYIKLNSISNNKLNLTIKEIEEKNEEILFFKNPYNKESPSLDYYKDDSGYYKNEKKKIFNKNGIYYFSIFLLIYIFIFAIFKIRLKLKNIKNESIKKKP